MPGKIGILLSGLGFENGTQVLELPFIYQIIEKHGALPVCLIPNKLAPSAGRGKAYVERDLLAECEPVIRGEGVAVKDIDPQKLSGLIIPGGKGPITVLTDISEAGADARVVRAVQDLIVGVHVRGKPVGSLGYGGALALVALKRSIEDPIITLGEDAVLTGTLSALGIAPVNVGPHEVIFDEDNLLLSASGISPGSSISKGAEGVIRLTEAILEMRNKKR